MATFKYTARVDPNRMQAGTIEARTDRAIVDSVTQGSRQMKKNEKIAKNFLTFCLDLSLRG
jgi:hypothetical protein